MEQAPDATALATCRHYAVPVIAREDLAQRSLVGGERLLIGSGASDSRFTIRR
jgi:hypothetical protein